MARGHQHRHPVRSGRAPLRHTDRQPARLVPRGSPRPIWTGSIAATPTAPGTPGSSRHPVRSGRAPLRPVNNLLVAYLTSSVTPSDLDGLHCGGANDGTAGSSMLGTPSDLDGLHCGTRKGIPLPDVSPVTPSDLDGLHCGRMSGRGARTTKLVTPSDLDGLHCGDDLRDTAIIRLAWSPRPIWTG